MKLPPVEYGRLASLLTDPKGTCDVVIDTDTYNEVDDQFAIMHALMSKEFNIETIQAAPFHAAVRNTKSHQHGMEMSYEEIANELEIPLGTVKAQLHRSREQLFNIMSGAKGSF